MSKEDLTAKIQQASKADLNYKGELLTRNLDAERALQEVTRDVRFPSGLSTVMVPTSAGPCPQGQELVPTPGLERSRRIVRRPLPAFTCGF